MSRILCVVFFCFFCIINMVMNMYKRRILILAGIGCGVLGAVAVFYLLAQQGIGIGCPVYQLTGLRCPGCGNSRAALALLQLELVTALQYNWLFPLEFGYLLWFLGKSCAAYLRAGRFSYQPKSWWPDAAVLAAVLLWGILRNILGI